VTNLLLLIKEKMISLEYMLEPNKEDGLELEIGGIVEN
jgi:hypothetical protein